jgi:hypothetical protein
VGHILRDSGDARLAPLSVDADAGDAAGERFTYEENRISPTGHHAPLGHTHDDAFLGSLNSAAS